MSVTWLRREMGLVVRCNGCNCPAKFHTGLIIAGNVREWLKKNEGWGRGSRTGTKKIAGTKRHDLCPPCLKLDKELAAQDAKDRAERKAQRDEARKAKFAAKATVPKVPKSPKSPKPRKKSASPTPSPSADSAQAPAT